MQNFQMMYHSVHMTFPGHISARSTWHRQCCPQRTSEKYIKLASLTFLWNNSFVVTSEIYYCYEKVLSGRDLTRILKITILVWIYTKPNLVFSQFQWCAWGIGGGGGVSEVQKLKLLRMVWNMFWFWNFWNSMKFHKWPQPRHQDNNRCNEQTP